MDEVRSQVHWVDLPSGLWATIFRYLKPVNKGTPCTRLQYDLQRFYELATVCSKISLVFAQEPGINATLVLSDNLQKQKLPATLQGICQHYKSIKTLVTMSQNAEWLETVLETLQSKQSVGSLAGLARVHLQAVTPKALLLLSRFSQITECSLTFRRLGLHSFKSLHHLTKLQVQNGTVTDLDAAKHLTCLRLYSCKAICTKECSCVSSLQELAVCKSHVMGFNVTACENLQALECRRASISAALSAESLMLVKHSHVQFPASMAKLSALSSLNLSVRCSPSDVSLDWLCDLRGLQSLSTNMDVPSLTLPGSISRLSNLRNMLIRNSDTVRFGFDWAGLVAIERIEVYGMVRFDAPLIGMADAQQLQRVVFGGYDRSDSSCQSQISLLKHRLRSEKPDVTCTLRLDDCSRNKFMHLLSQLSLPVF